MPKETGSPVVVTPVVAPVEAAVEEVAVPVEEDPVEEVIAERAEVQDDIPEEHAEVFDETEVEASEPLYDASELANDEEVPTEVPVLDVPAAEADVFEVDLDETVAEEDQGVADAGMDDNEMIVEGHAMEVPEVVAVEDNVVDTEYDAEEEATGLDEDLAMDADEKFYDSEVPAVQQSEYGTDYATDTTAMDSEF